MGYDSIEVDKLRFRRVNQHCSSPREMQDTMQNYAAVFPFSRELGIGWVEIDKVVEKFNVSITDKSLVWNTDLWRAWKRNFARLCSTTMQAPQHGKSGAHSREDFPTAMTRTG
jgi:succinate dehydrogenase/fumarate reductase flavoprotein subunit